MKTFEERFTAWVDGQLTGSELADFEQELVKVRNSSADKTAALQLGELLRSHGRAPALGNEDFFNHQLMQRIAAERPRATAREQRAAPAWPLLRLVLGGAICLFIAAVLYTFAIPDATRQSPLDGKYLAQAVTARAGDPSISATAFRSRDNNATVVWLDGLEYIPSGYQIQ
jgi:hypothetical protein